MSEADLGVDGDVLRGADEICTFLFGRGAKRHKVYYLARTGVLPCFHIGKMVCARKSRLTRFVAEQEAKGMARTLEAA